MKRLIYSLIAFLPFLASCDGTWVMYDTGQKDHIYFQDRIQTIMKSFALLSTDEIDVAANVYVMGNVSDVDRPFKVESVDSRRHGADFRRGGVPCDLRQGRCRL